MTEQAPTGHNAENSEPTGNATPQAQTAADPAGTDPPNPTQAALQAAQAEADKWKRYKRSQEDELKDLREQIKRLVDPAEVKTVEQQLRDATSQLNTAQTMEMRYRVALEEGLPPNLAARLQGDTEKAIRADAAALRELIQPKAAGAVDAAAVSGPNTGEAQPRDLSALMRAAARRK